MAPSFLSQPVGAVCLSEGGSVRWAGGALHTLTVRPGGEPGGWWVDQPASGCPAGFSKKYLEGQRQCAITVIMAINAEVPKKQLTSQSDTTTTHVFLD